MKKFDAYAQEADRLCNRVLAESAADLANQQLLRMQEKINRSELTVYQKDFLLQLISSTRNVVHARNKSIIRNSKRIEQNACFH